MANYYFQRDTKVFIHVGVGTTTKSMYYELPVLDGYSFSQATNTSEITLNQAQTIGGVSLRARQMFNDSYAPAEWSFSTYMSPFQSAASAAEGTNGIAGATSGDHQEVSEALWAMFFGQRTGNGLDSDGDNLGIVQTEANAARVGVFDLYFVFGGAAMAYTGGKPANFTGANIGVYKISDCSVNEFSFDFDIDGIATVAWSGMGKIVSEESALNGLSGTTTIDGADYTVATSLITEGVTNTTGFIRNRLSDLTIAGDASGGSVTYVVTLTGGNITFSNNLTYLTPETLGIVNQPLGHVTGSRTIGGNLTCYLDNEANASAELFEDIIEATTDIQNVFSLAFDIGASGTPHLLLTMATCHLEVPSHSIDDVISLETNFHALPSTIGGTNEVTLFDFVGKDVG